MSALQAFIKHLGPNLQAEGLEGERVTEIQARGWKIRAGGKARVRILKTETV